MASLSLLQMSWDNRHSIEKHTTERTVLWTMQIAGGRTALWTMQTASAEDAGTLI